MKDLVGLYACCEKPLRIDGYLTLGKRYKVIGVDEEYERIKIIDDLGIEGHYRRDRFEYLSHDFVVEQQVWSFVDEKVRRLRVIGFDGWHFFSVKCRYKEGKGHATEVLLRVEDTYHSLDECLAGETKKSYAAIQQVHVKLQNLRNKISYLMLIEKNPTEV